MANKGMYQLVRKMYNQVYYILLKYNVEAQLEPNNDMVYKPFHFKTLDRGLDFRDPNNARISSNFPWCFVGRPSTTPVESRRSPRVWEYEVTIPVGVMTFADKGQPMKLVFNEDLYDGEEDLSGARTLEQQMTELDMLIVDPYGNNELSDNPFNKNAGAWDLAEKVSDFFWDNHHVDKMGFRGSASSNRGNEGDYTIIDWTSRIGSTDIPAVQVLLYDAFYDAVQIDFIFKLQKRDSLNLV